MFAIDPLREQNSFDDVQLLVTPGLEKLGQIGLEQKPVHEGLVFFVRQIGFNDRLKEFGVLLEQEE